MLTKDWKPDRDTYLVNVYSETDPSDEHDRTWIIENWSLAFAKLKSSLYGDGPYPWNLDWPHKTRRPRCSVETCNAPVIVLWRNRIVLSHCSQHVDASMLAAYGYQIKGIKYKSGATRFTIAPRKGKHTKAHRSLKDDKETARKVKKYRQSKEPDPTKLNI